MSYESARANPWSPLVPLVYWTIGKAVLGATTHVLAPLSAYGRDRIPRHGGAILAMNHFHAIDPACFGTACPRRIVFVAKTEAHEQRGLGELMRAHGALAIRRGESDRDALRRMRETVRDNHLLGMFVEGTRQRSGVPGEPKPGTAMIAINEGVPVVPAALEGTQAWSFGGRQPVAVAFGEPMRFDGYPRNSRGYREASAEIMDEIVRLWRFLKGVREQGSPPGTPPRRASVPARF
jgi:1-acyl-sn-glycerol-3-phosphate acyltransferase